MSSTLRAWLIFNLSDRSSRPDRAVRGLYARQPSLDHDHAIAVQLARLNQVTIAVSDLERSVAFYRRLGLTQIVADERYARSARHHRRSARTIAGPHATIAGRRASSTRP
jgi:catechol-2,3-dioxygenase